MATRKNASPKQAGATNDTTSVDKTDAGDALARPVIKRRELVQRVSERAGLRPNQVKPALEATLAELGEILSAGEVVNIPGFGKLRVQNRRELGDDAEALILKLRRKKPMAADADTLADGMSAVDPEPLADPVD